MHILKNSTPTWAILALLISFCSSCSKDADLLSDYVVTDPNAIDGDYALLVNDSYFIDMKTSVVLDVLSNDNFEDLDKVTITDTSTPEFGSIIINEDKTLTYVPKATSGEETGTSTTSPENPDTTGGEEEVVDTFVYTTEETTDAGEVSTSEATVTVTNTQNKLPESGNNVFYVTVNGKSSNNGKTESTAWDIVHAFKAAKAGDYVHIKAGNYGNKNLIAQNSGTVGSPIRFIGYKNTPGDIVSFEGSTFAYGDTVDGSKMPLIKSNTAGESGIGLHVHKDYIEIENLQIQLYERGIDSKGNSQILRNIITFETGPQNIDKPSGQGIVIRGNNTLVENCFDLNSVSQGITLNGATNSRVNFCEVYNDNEINPGGYYILLSGGTTNSIVENCTIYKKTGLFHGGHGFVMKDVATNNVFRKSVAYNTGIEANFRDVHDNLWEDIQIFGVWPESDRSDYSPSIKLSNGSHHNNFKNIFLKDVKRAFAFEDWDDGFEGNGGDLQQGSSYNQFDNITVENASRLVYFGPGTSSNTFSSNNVWTNCEFKNIDVAFALLTKNTNNLMQSCSFDKIDRWEMNNLEFNFTFENCTLVNSSFNVQGL